MKTARSFVSSLMFVLCMPTYAQHEGEVVATLAHNFIGVPYRFGGADPRGFDCSGLVQHIHSIVGREIPRTAQHQFQSAEPVSLEQLRKGDLLFFKLRGRLSHVAIYVGEGRFIHAPSRGKSVSYARLDNPFWRSRFQGAGRFLGDGAPIGEDEVRMAAEEKTYAPPITQQ